MSKLTAVSMAFVPRMSDAGEFVAVSH